MIRKHHQIPSITTKIVRNCVDKETYASSGLSVWFIECFCFLKEWI